MAPENNNKTVSDADTTDGSVSFSRVGAVATGWMVDFMFVSVCRRFKEGNLDGFNEALSAFQALSRRPCLKKSIYVEKTMICAFLARVMYGKQLDVLFEQDDSVMPLMSAAKLWADLELTVGDESLFKTITILLLVQSVAVCLEKGQTSSATSALKWFDANHKFPQNLGIKLSTVVSKKEPYHPFLMSFSFSRLLETIQSYLDAYLEKNPSDYLLQAATKTAQSSQSTEGLEDTVSQDNSLSETADESINQDTKKKKSAERLRTKRKLLPTTITDLWKPDSCKKLRVAVRQISQSEILQMASEKSVDTSKVQKTRKPPQGMKRQKWTGELDDYLKRGVRRYGEGKWSRILLDYDFEGRTGIMLKDRWRVLKRAHKVS